LDFISKTPPGTFFTVIELSLGFYDSNTVAGNLLGQGGIYWNGLLPMSNS